MKQDVNPMRIESTSTICYYISSLDNQSRFLKLKTNETNQETKYLEIKRKSIKK